jgi:peptide deformylase
MDVPEILQKEDPRLHQVSEPVPESLFGTDELKTIIAQLAAALDEQPDGVAIAAPQLGIMYRIFLVRYDRTRAPDEEGGDAKTDRAPEVGVFINPKFVNSSRRRIEMDEGCLSVRGLYGTTLRHERATIRAQDENGNGFERGGGGLLAQIYQHENDHLDGILFIDHAEDIVEIRRKKNSDETEEVPVSEDALEIAPIESE